MISTDKSGVRAFIQACLNNKLRHFVCSPGSRNAAIVIALDEHPEIETIVIHDERSAGFYALGMAQQLNAPVGVVCTSGSAMLNYYPAVAEAYYQCVPLVVVSADRPSEWINHGDGQTIVQKGVYENHIKFEMEVPEVANSLADVKLLNSDIDKAFVACNGGWKGPVHFNIPISEPLYNTLETEFVEATLNSIEIKEEEFDLASFSTLWKSSQRKMIICGQAPKNTMLLNILSELAKDTSVAILVENTSNLADGRFVQCIDRTLNAIEDSEVEAYKPEVLISIGGAIVSKRIKQFLRSSDLKSHWRIGFDFPEMNTYSTLSKSVQCFPKTFLSAVMNECGFVNNSTFGNRWKQKDYLVQNELPAFYANVAYSDLAVFELVLDYLPEDSLLHMGNSSVVRYCQLFDPIKSVSYFANRGTSGIDGSLSTACGAAIIAKNNYNVMITGDVSFFYDSNALWSNYLNENLRIILINNGGGGIFKIIDGPSSTKQLDTYFVTKQEANAEKLCEAFGVEYLKASGIDELEGQMAQFYDASDSGCPKLMEVFTPSEVNDGVLKQFFQKLKTR
ncbi:MAG: 2-succinyl-5-enolpyruvyl-6-hydroxy-3-cyclohexene-1-carboxylic-acid synthase [Crocinitomicaceae bacterium]|nr:2-succinyl-5-enolpyruvyl-6-hydroxy-3-cyclohexene-1-carboxylic-acid synthase [Crocinitomicaceae bacterium]